MNTTERSGLPLFFFVLTSMFNFKFGSANCVSAFVLSSERIESSAFTSTITAFNLEIHDKMVRHNDIRNRRLCSVKPSCFHRPMKIHSGSGGASLNLLSESFLENDLVAVILPSPVESDDGTSTSDQQQQPRLCVVRPDQSLAPLCQRSDDVETDLYIDPRCSEAAWTQDLEDDAILDGKPLGEGWYGQRPVPSLGGGPGYGAEADDVWSVDSTLMEAIEEKGILVPVLDVGIAHGEKARGGAF